MSRTKNARPSLATLAIECGVSRQTISNVINAPEIVAPETRRRVERAIQKSGYRPSAAARALRTQRSMTLVMRMHPAGDGINGVIIDRFIHGVVVEAQKKGYRVSLLTADSAENEAASIIELFEQGAADGALLTDTSQSDPRPGLLQAAGVPVAAFGRPWGNPDQTHDWVDVDGAAGTFGAVQALAELNLGPIGFLGWPSPSGVGDDRHLGWVEGLEAIGQPAALEERCIDDFTVGVGAAASLIARGARAIVCASDTLAAASIEALRRAGHLPPTGDIWPVIGFDNTAISRFRGFSSVEQPIEEAARHCVESVLDQIRHPREHTSQQVLLTPPVVIREPSIAPDHVVQAQP